MDDRHIAPLEGPRESNTSANDSTDRKIRELTAERDALERKVREIEQTMHNLYHELHLCKLDLETIYRSKMWRFWTTYHFLRRAPGVALRGLARLCGQVYLSMLIPALFLRARVRGWWRTEEELTVAVPGEDVAAGRRRPRVLIVMPYAIFPPDHGGGVRLYNLLRHLSRSCDISVLVFSQAGEDPAQRKVLETWCRSVDFHHWFPRLKPDLFGLEPPNRQIFQSEEAHRLVEAIIERQDVDVLQLEYTELGQYQTAAPDHVKVILTEHDIAFRSLERRRKQRFNKRFPEGNYFGNTRADWRRLVRYEVSACRDPDQVHVMSAADGAFLANFLADGRRRLRVLPNGVDTQHYVPSTKLSERSGVLLVGNFQNLPNVDSLEYLATDIWPLLRKRRPQETLSVVGAKASERVLRFDGQDGITVVGAVPDLKPWYGSHRVLAVPLRAGSGTRLKLLETFAAGLPAVSTTLGAEGIAYEDGRHLLIADTPESFAEALDRLLTEDELHEEVARAARALVCEKYCWERVAEAMVASYMELVGEKLSQSPEPIARSPEPAKPEEPVPERPEPAGAEPEEVPEEVPDVDEVRPEVTETVTVRPEEGGGDVLVLGIYLANQPNYVHDAVRVLSQTEHYEVHQSWVALFGEPPSERVARVTVKSLEDRTPKCAILNELLAGQDLERYEYVVICDDDVALPERFLDQFLTLQSRLDFAVAQPARTVGSYVDLPIVEQHPGVLARRTLFVEQGPVISFHRSAFDIAFPFDLTSPMGWGLENVWSLEVSRHGLKMGIVDNVPVDHSMRKPVANYAWEEADRGRSALFAKVEHRPNEECFKVLELVPLGGPDHE